MGVGLRPIEKSLDLPPNPKVARAVFLSQPLMKRRKIMDEVKTELIYGVQDELRGSLCIA